MKRSMVSALFVSLSLLLTACGQSGGGGSGGSGGSKKPTDTPDNPPPGTVSDVAGFFIKLSGEYADLFSIHKGESNFSEKCEASLGERAVCIVEAEETRFRAHDVSLHYHIPKTMCEYVTVRPYYFINRKTKWQSSTLHTYVDSNGEFGIDNDLVGAPGHGTVDTSDIGCYTEDGEPVCCLGSYNWVKHIWDDNRVVNGAPEPGYEVSTPTPVKYTAEKCVGGSGASSEFKSEWGFPTGTYYYVPGEGKSATYDIKKTDDFSLETQAIVWSVNYFNPTDHPAPAVNGVPTAMKYDIDTTPNNYYVGYPYYSVICYDQAWEVKSQIDVLLRDWDTKAAYDARASAPTGYRDEGFEDTPFGTHPKNDYWNWKDIEVETLDFPLKLPQIGIKK